MVQNSIEPIINLLDTESIKPVENKNKKPL